MTTKGSDARHARFRHALVVGGTGMLADATRFVRAQSARMTLVARRAEAADLTRSPDEACPVDWRDFAAFWKALSPRIRARRPDLALLWMHASGERALHWLLAQLVTHPVLIVHVLGSSSGDPRACNESLKAILSSDPSVQYVTVVLGSKALPGGRRRWLTNAEISAGAIEAIQTGRDVVVGEIVPVD
jgi:hypothetical protein